MAYRRKLTSIKLDKIAGVDLPCQEHAVVAIIKRAVSPEKRKELADKGMAMPDGSFPIETVADLKNAVQAHGRASDKPAAKRHIIRRAKALDAVEHLPAEWDVKKALAKATFDDALQANMTASAVNCAFFESFDGLWQRNDAFREALTDELAGGGDGTEASAAYVDSVRQLVDNAVQQAREAGASATDTSPIDKSLSAAVEKWLGTRKEQTMKITTKAELKAAVAKFNPETSPYGDVVTIKKAATELSAEDLLPADGPLAKDRPDPEIAKMQRELAVLKLSPEARKHYEALDESGQTAFIGKSADDQTADIAKASSADPVVYKCKDGTEIRKSDGTAAVMFAKRADAQDEKIAKLEGDLSGSTFEKRAGDEYPNVAKNVAVEMLKSATQVGVDTDTGKAVLKTLKTMNDGGSRLMKSLGSSEDGGTPSPGGIAKARTDFDKEVTAIAKRDSIGRADAMSKARVEHPDLYEEAYPETVEAVREAEDRAASAQAE